MYCTLWNPEQHPPSPGLADTFYRLRPVVENGWEMPVVLHALESGFSEEDILQNWSSISLELLHHHNLDPNVVGAQVDAVRDRWIVEDYAGWLACQTFYPGMVEYLKRCPHFVIVSTKDGRFIQALLRQAGVELQPDQLYGKERQTPKFETLRSLKTCYSKITFIEDRIKTLHSVAKQPDLGDIELLLADWGYNLPSERAEAKASDRIRLVSRTEFLQDSI